MRLLRAVGIALLLAALSTIAPATAQSPDTSPLIDLTPLLGGTPPAVEERTHTPAAQANINAPARHQPLATPRLVGGESALVKLSDKGVLRLSGERAVARFVVDVPDLTSDAPFRLTYRNSINVLPEASKLRVLINGNEAATLATNVFGAFQTVDIPAPVLLPGQNEIVVEALHTHRIFCGINASFQIWTEINLAASGVPLPQGLARAGLADVLAALSRAEGGSAPIVIRATPAASRSVARVLAEQLTKLTGGRTVRVGTPWDPVRQGAGAPRVVLEPGPSASAEVLLGADGADVLRLVHGPVVPSDPEAALPELTADGPSELSFRAAPPDVPLLIPSEPTTIGDLGFTQRDEVASYVVQSVSFRLPSDWLSLSSQQGHIFFDYRFPQGLPQGANLLVKVNGTTVRDLPLDRGGGRELPTLDVGFLVSLLGPGINRIDFEAILEAENPEMPCPPWPDSVLTVEPTSTLLVPNMPAMYFDGMERSLPALTASGLRYNGGDGTRSRRFDRNDRRAIAAVIGTAHRAQPLLAEPTTLNILSADEFTTPVAGELTITRRRISTLLDGRDTPPANVGAGERGMIDAITYRLTRVMAWFAALALPGGPPLDAWLSTHTAEAMLLQPMENRPDQLVLILSPEARASDVARKIVADRMDRNGPRGRVALLDANGNWEIWRPPFDAPRLAGPVTLGNFRAVLGNYASWSPIGFAIVLFALTMLSGFIAIVYLRRTRDERY